MSAQTNLPSRCFQGSTWTVRGRTEDRRGATVACTPKESCVNKRHCTVVVAPGHGGSSQNVNTGALQADTSHILVPADSRVLSMLEHRTALSHPVVSTGIC